MARQKKQEEKKGGSPLWMTTYGDMVTLLLAFFVMLFSFSTIDAIKWQALVASLTGNIAVFEGGPEFTPMPGMNDEVITREMNREDDSDRQQQDNDEFYQLYLSISNYLEENEIQAEVDISEEYTEILIRFRDYIMFDSGKAEIKPEAKPILDKIAEVLLEYDHMINRIRVEGHTDNVPMDTFLYPSNWELSVGRSTRVVRYFQESHNIKGEKLMPAGYSEYHPIATNDTVEGRALNRRVDILIVRTIDIIDNTDMIKE